MAWTLIIKGILDEEVAEALKKGLSENMPPTMSIEIRSEKESEEKGHWNKFFTDWHDGSFVGCTICNPSDEYPDDREMENYSE